MQATVLVVDDKKNMLRLMAKVLKKDARVLTAERGQAALEALATQDRSGPAIVGDIAGDCPIEACGTEVGRVLTDTSEAARNALGDCIATCVSERSGLSLQCTGCYGSTSMYPIISRCSAEQNSVQ